MTKNPLLITLILLILFVSVLTIPIESVITDLGSTVFQADKISGMLKNILIVAISVILIKKARVFELSGLDRQFEWSHKYLTLIPFYLILFGVLELFEYNFSETTILDIILLFLYTMSVGFSEEFMFRGLICPIWMKKYVNKKKGMFLSIFIPALLFGLLHLLNFKTENLSSEISQLLYAIFFGTFFGAVLFRTNRLLPIAIVHGLIDFVFGFDSLFENTKISKNVNFMSDLVNAIVSSIVVLPLFIVGIMIIRKLSKVDIAEKITLSNEKNPH